MGGVCRWVGIAGVRPIQLDRTYDGREWVGLLGSEYWGGGLVMGDASRN